MVDSRAIATGIPVLQGGEDVKNALVALDNERRISGFHAFVTMVKREGVPSPFFEENLPIDTVRTVHDDNGSNRLIEHDQTTFARVIADALATKPKKNGS